MTYPPNQPYRDDRFPPLEAAPLDYPSTYPPYPPPAPVGYPAPVYANPYAPYGYPPPRPTNGLAITSLVVSLVSLVACAGAPGFIGLILGIIGMRQTKERAEEGYGMALAGTIIGALCTVGWVVALIFFFLIPVFILGVAGTSSTTYEY